MKIQWKKMTQALATIQRKDGKCLGLAVVPNGRAFIAAAIESETQNDFNQVLESHSHQTIGQDYNSLERAQKAAERYAAKWLENAVSSDPCACDDIDGRQEPL